MNAPSTKARPVRGRPFRFAYVNEACTYAVMSRATLYRHLWAGRFAARKRGHRTLIDLDSLDEYLAGLPEWRPGPQKLAELARKGRKPKKAELVR